MPSSIYLKITKAAGSSKTEDFKEQIELISCSHNIEFPMTPNERSNNDGKWHGRTKHDAFSVVKRADKASPNLMLYCSSGEEVGTATITVFGNNKNKLFTYEMEKVFVTAVEVSVS